MKNETLKNIIKESITDYLSELNSINEEETSEETKKESLTSTPGLMFEDKVTKDKHVYLVKEAMNESTEKDLVEKKLLLDLIGEGYKGAYLNEASAMKAAKTAIKERETLMKENIKKGQVKVGGLEKQVADLKAEMAKLMDNPEMRGELSNYTAKLEKAEQVLEKLKAAIEKSSPKKEKKEEKLEENITIKENFSIVWDKSKLTRTTYENGKQYTSQKFKSVEELLANKEKADEVQKKREEKGRDKIKHTLK